MISGWRYDDGKGIWSDAIRDWIGQGKPCHRCVVSQEHRQLADDVEDWLRANSRGGSGYDAKWRFNGGNSYLSFELFGRKLPMLFLLRWAEHMTDED